jgi:hypothetical protein
MGVIEHFRIGQPVEVVPDYRYGEWQGIPLFIVAVRHIERSAFDVTYDVSERWPTQSHGDVTTDFTPDDLVARNAEPIHRRDGDEG